MMTEPGGRDGAVVAFDWPDSLAGLFETQVSRTPDAVAVECDGLELTYAQLDRQANRLANVLQQHGVGAGALVGLCLERSAELPVALIAVLKAGGAYVPLDPEYPPSRLELMLRDARAALLVTDSELVGRFESGDTPILCLDRETDAVAQASDARPSPAATLDDLGYVIYTSGSTGTPKGVAMGQRALANLLLWHLANPRLAQPARALQFTPLSFDVSFQEIMSTWCSGGTLVMVSDEERLDPEKCLRFMDARRIERLFLPFVALQCLAEAAGRIGTVPPSLRDVITAGEQLQVNPHIASFFEQLADCPLHNHYGPTETHVVTSHVLTGPPSVWPPLPPIGRPIANTQIHILDDNGKPVSPGETGELHVGGTALAQGYLHRPELTGERFLPDPFSADETARLYRTGDLARQLPAGDIEFLGRRDAQLKIRGYRIEPGEVEVALGEHAGVRQAAVIAREDEPGEKRLVAYVVAAGTPAVSTSAIRRHLAERLPDYMVPSAFVVLDGLPRTPSGKIDRRNLPPPGRERPDLDHPYAAPRSDRERAFAEVWCEVLELDKVGIDDSFFELGGTSLLSLQAIARLRERHAINVPVVRLFEQPTIAQLAGSQDERAAAPLIPPGPASTATDEPVAVIGMVGRFPGADNVPAFWKNLCEGKETVSLFEDGELDPSVPPELRQDPDYVRARGIIEDADKFDAAFFGISPREAEILDPQQRVFLELAWAALENAGYDPLNCTGQVGVFAGIGNNTYYPGHVMPRPQLVQALGAFQTMVANEKDYVSTRVAYKLNLRGPALSIHTACSTSLVAIAEALHHLRAHRCDVALAGGASVSTPQNVGYLYQEGGMLAKDGHCRPFDAAASGTTFNNGAGIVVLKRLSDALRDGDTIYALLKGGGINNDGADKMSFTAPSVAGQAQAIAMAHADAGIDPASIGYVEAHGTATPLGDPIEVEALTKAFRARTDKGNFCALGSVKSNVGHLIAAAGVTGFIKAVLAVYHGKIPPTLHFTAPNPAIPFEGSPFYVNNALLDWPGGTSPRRAGVSSFGVGGTNAHVVLEEPGEQAPATDPTRPCQLLLQSAKTAGALDRMSNDLADFLETHPDAPLADAAYTLHVGRAAFRHRRAVVCTDGATAAEALRTLSPKTVRTRCLDTAAEGVVFMFPGQGTQYPGMGRDLYEHEPVFRDVIDACAERLRTALERDLREVLYPEASGQEGAAELLRQTFITQPALVATQIALARLWMHWGIQPAAMVGHSIGEFSCACISGIFGLEDTLDLVAARGRLMQDLPSGTMLSVRLPAEEAEALLDDRTSIAAVNGPSLCVVSGPDEAIEAVKAELKQRKVACRPLNASHAFHSPMMDPIREPFLEHVKAVERVAPKVPFVSTVTTDWITDEQATDPQYWAGHLRATVRFAEAARRLWEEGQTLMLEVGPGTTASTLARQQATDRKCQVAVSSLGRADAGKAEWPDLLAAIGQLWLCGVGIDWSRFYATERRRRIPLPTYPFERKRFWLEAVGTSGTPTGETLPEPGTAEDGAAGHETTPTTAEGGLMGVLREVMADASGMDLGDADEHMTFLDMGMDSLFLTQVSLTIRRKFGVRVSFRQLMEDFPTLASLTAHLEEQLPEGAVQAAAPSAPAASAGTDGEGPEEPPRKRSFGAAARIDTTQRSDGLSDAQRAALDTFIAEYTERTRSSKAFTQKNRAQLADPRAVSGFRAPIKELIYPIVVKRSEGSRLWDIDNNEYVDLTCGFGSNFFGNRAPFVVDAVKSQLDTGYEIGPQHPLVDEVAAGVCRLTGFDRVAFCNTGSEAVLGAMRISRTVTGRHTIVMFEGDYHGIFDEVIVRAGRDGKGMPAAAGIPRGSTENVLILEYGTPETLEIIRSRLDDIAAILVEPVQSRRPGFQPVDFLKELRRMTEQAETALIFDEVITGFRVHEAGAQGVFGIKAEIGTYGKVIGAGLPIGVIAGRKEYMDALDGGFWQFGDDSFPEIGVTYFAGTFVRHPLVLAAARAAIQRLEEGGPELFADLNARATALTEELTAYCRERNAPVRVPSFGSLFMITFTEEVPQADLLYARLRHKGVHAWDHRPCFLTLAHGDEDIAHITRAFKEAIDELLAAGLLPEATPTPPGGDVDTPSQQKTTFPATEAQKEIWVAASLGGDEANAAYNESISLRLQGTLNVEAMRTALRQVAERHDALRSTFSADGNTVSVGEPGDVEAPLIDLSPHNEGTRREQLDAVLVEAVSTPFDLQNGPLFRPQIVRLATEEHLLVITAHHIVCDGWSMAALLLDLGRFYSAAVTNRAPELDPVYPFSAYAAREAERTSSADYAEDEAFWIDTFSGPVPGPDLPTDLPRPHVRSPRADRQDYPIGGELVTDLKRVGSQGGCSFFNVLLAAFQVMLYRLSGETDLVVGVPSAGQSAIGEDFLVGHCVNFLPVRCRIEPGHTFHEHLQAQRSVFLDSFEHQGYTMGSLLSHLSLPRDPSRLPLVSVCFNIDKEPAEADLPFEGLQVEFLSNPRTFESFEINLNVVESGDRLVVECQYRTDLFTAESIRRRLGNYETLLAAVAAAPETPIDELPVLTGGEQALLDTWNDTAMPHDRAVCLHGLVESQAAATPDAPAIVEGEQSITYEELNARANRLAGHLVAEGVVPDSLVGICMSRSADLVVAVLAVLKAGAAYVPLDPAYPEDRLAFMVEDSAAAVVLTETALAGRFPADTTRAVCVDTLGAELDEREAGNLQIDVAPDSLAYVIYTSGSTGRPKGVAIEHRNTVALLAWAGETFSDAELARVLFATSICFDLSVFEIFAPLVRGGTIVLAENVLALPSLAAADGITFVNTVPSAIAELLRDHALPASVKTVALAGEPLSAALADQIYASGTVKRVYDLYGPSEDTTYSTCALREEGGRQTIGRPIANTAARILDTNLQPVPIGVPGQLYLGGEGLARGYLNRPELTAERFIPDPFSDDDPGARLYATGDLVRYFPDGAIEFLGRMDYQVKIRGFRVELGEIETVIGEHEAVERAVAVVREDRPGDQRLVVYYVPGAGQAPTATVLRKCARVSLPVYMVPQHFVELDDFPLTPSNKIDRKALPPVFAAAQAAPPAAPRNAMEEYMVAVWREALGTDAAGIHDNFFDLGGHSLLSMQVISRVKKEKGIALSPRSMLMSTLAQVAGEMDAETEME